jgi:hypothetical protein
MADTGQGTKVFIDKYDFSAQGRSVDISVDQNVVDATTFSGDAKTFIGGVIEAKIDYKGVWNKSDSAGLDAWLTSNFNVINKGITVIPGAPAGGGVAYHGEILAVNKPSSIPYGELITMDAGFTINKMIGHGTILTYNGTATGAQIGTGRNLGTATSGTSGYCTTAGQDLLCSMHLWEWNGSGTYTVTLQEASANTSASYTAVTSGVMSVSGGVTSYFYRIPGSRKSWLRTVTTVQSGNATCKWVAVASPVDR